jgi:hypothetical protein
MVLNRILIITFFCCSTTVLFGQEIKLNITCFNPCSSTYEPELLVALVKDNKTFQIADTRGTFHLPEPGTYELKFFDQSFYRLRDSVQFIQINYGQNYDTLTYTTITKCFFVGGHKGGECGYSCCNNLCEGYYVDYYDNGKKKIEGNFKNGLPIGELIFYKYNGAKTQIHYYDKKGLLIKKEIIK